ncbi:MAG: branched-chain amino acid ABC transporter permease [Ilumatobacteraceae bacterium]|nr:branched-chain amino acid ABC transporter permease [Ilumatobacteraceae bacterium]
MSKFVALFFSGLTVGSIYSLVAVGILLLYKATSVVNAAQFGLVGLGGYVAFWGTDSFGLPLVATYAMTIVVMGVVGLILERVAYAPLRNRAHETVLLSTLAGGFAIVGLVVLWYGPEPRNLPSPFGFDTFKFMGAAIPQHSLFVIGTTMVLVLSLALMFNRTQFGRQVRAIAADRDTARLQGIPVNRLSLITFAVASSTAGLAGALLAPFSALTPQMGFTPMLLAFGAAIMGGFGRLWGVVIGSVALGLAQQLGGGYILPNMREAFPFLLMFIVIAVRPEGLFGGEASVRL